MASSNRKPTPVSIDRTKDALGSNDARQNQPNERMGPEEETTAQTAAGANEWEGNSTIEPPPQQNLTPPNYRAAISSNGFFPAALAR